METAVLVRLRSTTAEAHRRVESRLFPSALADRASYAAMLQVLLALHEPLEAGFRGLGGFSELGIDLPVRTKSPRLRADLAAMQTAPSEQAPTPLRATDLPTALGAFYVLEGSTLGGRVLLRQARERLGDVPTSFLTGYGDATGRFWRHTRGALVAGVRSADDPESATDDMVAGAVATFTELDRLLTLAGWATA